MNCMNHPTEAAVAQCTDCGKGLCIQCASQFKPILCDACAQKRKKHHPPLCSPLDCLHCFIYNRLQTEFYGHQKFPRHPDIKRIYSDVPSFRLSACERNLSFPFDIRKHGHLVDLLCLQVSSLCHSRLLYCAVYHHMEYLQTGSYNTAKNLTKISLTIKNQYDPSKVHLTVS